MSTSYTAMIIVGFVITKEPHYKTVTKYDQDTGKPYDTEVNDFDIGFIQGQEVVNTQDNPDAMYDGESFEGLQFFETYDGKLLGIVLNKVTPDGDTLKEVNTRPQREVMQFAEKYGVEPKTYLAMLVG